MIQRVLKNELSNRRAAIQLHISERQFYNLKKKYKRYGDQSLIHGNTGRKPATAIPQELRDEIIAGIPVESLQPLFRKSCVMKSLQSPHQIPIKTVPINISANVCRKILRRSYQKQLSRIY